MFRKVRRVKILEDLVEEYKERKVNYSTYEFDELSYRTLILDIHTMLKENQKYKEAISKLRELHHEFAIKNSMLVFENNNLIDFMNNLINILKEVEHE